jgi:hypothetical protein
MSVTGFETPSARDFDLPFQGKPRRARLWTALGWFAILGLIAAVIGATLGFAA